MAKKDTTPSAVPSVSDFFSNANDVKKEEWLGLSEDAAKVKCGVEGDLEWTAMKDLIGREIVIIGSITRQYRDKDSQELVTKQVYLYIPKQETLQLGKFSSESAPFNDRILKSELPVKGSVEKIVKGAKSYYIFQ